MEEFFYLDKLILRLIKSGIYSLKQEPKNLLLYAFGIAVIYYPVKTVRTLVKSSTGSVDISSYVKKKNKLKTLVATKKR